MKTKLEKAIAKLLGARTAKVRMQELREDTDVLEDCEHISAAFTWYLSRHGDQYWANLVWGKDRRKLFLIV